MRYNDVKKDPRTITQEEIKILTTRLILWAMNRKGWQWYGNGQCFLVCGLS